MESYTSHRYRRDEAPPEQVNIRPEGFGKIPPGFTCAPSLQVNPLPVILLILLASPYIKSNKTHSPLMDQGMTDQGMMDQGIDLYSQESDMNMDESDLILDMLSSIYPYVDSKLQDGINLVFGLSETRDKLMSLVEGTYQAPRVFSLVESPRDYKERAVGIIRSLQPYISLENQTLINRALDISDTMETLVNRLDRFRRESNIRTQSPMGINLPDLVEIIDIVKILVPGEQQQQLSQISNIIRVIETVELAQLLNTSHKVGPTYEAESEPPSKGSSPSAKIKGGPPVKGEVPEEKMRAMSDILKTMLNPEQAKSVDLIMNMAQLLSKDSQDKKNAD